MKTAPQRKMKPSGVDWIGNVPEGWDIDKFCYRFDFAKGLDITKQDLTETGVPVVSYGQIHSKRNDGVHLTDELLRHIPTELTKGEYAARLKRNDFVFADTSEDVEGIGNCVTVNRDEVIYAGYHTLVARPIEKVNCGYFGYLFKSECWRQQLRRKANSVKVYSISQRLFKGVSILLPPLDEQKRIAAKLDRLCGRVDELAANLTKEIAALQDYRKSLITECVTKGLNPKAKMKPSGVEWIGKIPAGWTVMRTKYVSRVQTGPFGTQLSADSYTEDGSGVPCVNVKNIGDGVFRVDDLDRVQEDVAERLVNYEIKRGDVIFARKGSVDKRTVAEEEQDGWILGSDSIGVRFDEDVLPRYACYYYGNGVMGQHLHKMAKGSTMPSMNAEIIGNLEIIIPPFDEQCRIAALLDEKCAVIDTKIEERKGQLEKLTEYRSSVIYEYVTGKREVMVDGSSDGG